MKLTSTTREDANAWAELAAVELALGHRAAAARAAEEALVRDADVVIARRVRGDLARDAGDTTQAIVDYDRALAVAPSDVDALVGRGLAHLIDGRADDARRDLERAVNVAPRSARARFALGVALAASGDDARAALELEQAAALAGEEGRAYPQAHYLRAGALARLGKKRDALAAYREFLREADGDATLAEAVADAHTQIAQLGGR
jgi:tetratricopeptide (TPR) repeat protein